VTTPIAVLTGNRKAAWIAGGIALVLVAALELPIFGVPLAVAVATYTSIRLSKPYAVLRGRTLSASQQQRAALIGAAALLGLGGVFSWTVYGFRLANILEHRLQDSLRDAQSRGELRPGQLFEECDLVCAQAIVIEIPAYNSPGIAKLNGYALHDRLIYQWRSWTVVPENNPADSQESKTGTRARFSGG
jgi:hypothetical protein